MAEALVAGHICLDIIPELPRDVAFIPGRLVESGPATLSTGGAVANTGLSLALLGADVRLVGKIGADPFGRTIREMLDSYRSGLGDSMTVVDDGNTSYTIVLNLPGQDRMFLHDPGCNATFVSADVAEEALEDARVLHFGYPTLMPAMFHNDGEELVKLLGRAKRHGLLTSLDMTVPDANSESGRVDWRRLLSRVLPLVDVFLPNVEEGFYMLEGQSLDHIPDAGDEIYSKLATEMLAMGAKFAGIKAGDQGLYLRVSADAGSVDLARDWVGGEYWVPSFEVEVAGTTGAGDATIAGFLMGLLRGFSPEETLNAACAAGACCCERPDAASGIRPWSEIQERIDEGWSRRKVNLGDDWTARPTGVFSR